MAGEMQRDAWQDENGQWWIRKAGRRQAEQATAEQAEAFEQGRMARFGSAVADGAESLGRGAVDLLTRANEAMAFPGWQVDEEAKAANRDRLDALEARHEGRAAVDPVSNIAEYAPDVAIGLATGGAGSLAARVGTTALVEGGLGAARNPDNPAMGALVQGGLGAAGAGATFALPFTRHAAEAVGDAVGSVTDRVVSRFRGVIDAGLDADDLAARAAKVQARAADRAAKGSTQPPRGLLSADEAEQMGLPMSRGDKAFLSAGDNRAMAKAGRMRDREATGLLGGRGTEAVREAQQDYLTKRVLGELGANAKTLAPEVRQRLRGDVQKSLDDILKASNQPIPSERLAAQIDAIEGGMGADTFMRTMDLGFELRTVPEQGVIAPQHFRKLRQSIDRKLDRAIQNGDQEATTALVEIRDAMDDAFEVTLEPEQQALFQQVRKRGRIMRALDSEGAVDNRTGTVNPGSFSSYYQTQKPATRRTVSDNFERTLETVKFLTTKSETGSSLASRISLESLNGAADLLGIDKRRLIAGGLAAAGAATGLAF